MSHYYGRPLEVKIERDAIAIRIGIQTLAHAVSCADWANPYDYSADDYVRTFAIEDERQFAKDVVHEMLREEEDGSTPLSDFLDQMSENAVNNGSLGLSVEDHRIRHGQNAPCEKWANRGQS